MVGLKHFLGRSFEKRKKSEGPVVIYKESGEERKCSYYGGGNEVG